MKPKLCLIVAAAWSLILPREALASGACTAARFHDWQDMGCNQLFASAGTPAKSGCPPCNGMPRWWVSEPYENLCLKDTPLSYTMSSGKEMGFTFYYRQRAELPQPNEVPDYYFLGNAPYTPRSYTDNYLADTWTGGAMTNAVWRHAWMMDIVFWDLKWESYPSFGSPPQYPIQRGTPIFSDNSYEALVFNPQGGLYYFYNANGQSSLQEPRSQARLQPAASYPTVTNQPSTDANGIYWGDDNMGFKLLYPDGAQDVFSLCYYTGGVQSYGPYVVNLNTTARALLTQRIDPQGRVTQLGYEAVLANSFPLGYRLKYVVDPDERTNTFCYVATNNFVLTEIDDPYGRKTTLGYDVYGRMNRLTDAVTNSSSFGYLGANGWINQLTTPYGTNHFVFYEVPESDVTNGFQQRAIYATEPTGAQQLYFYDHNNPYEAASDTSPTVPGQTNFDNGNSGSYDPSLIHRNSYHWGRLQFEALPYYYVQEYLGDALAYPASSDSWFSQALSHLSENDFNKAELKHWLLSSADNVSITESLSSERDPSPDPAGTTPGLRTWYNYSGKPSGEPEELGSDPKTTCIARVLPDGTSQYTTYNYYAITGIPSFPAGAGFVSDNESTYSKPDDTIGTLTNRFTYAANSVDLISISNSAGQYVNYGYNGSHQITTATNALNQVTTLNWDVGATWNLLGVQLPSGTRIGLGYYWTSTSNLLTNMLQNIVIQPEGRTFTVNNYSAGSPSSITDDRGLTVANTWDGLNRLTSTSFPDNTTISNIYNRLDWVAAKDRLGNWTHLAYDGLQHLTNVINANNAVTRYSWCGCGSLSEIMDAQNGTNGPTYLNYDNQGNLVNVVFPDTSSLTYQFDLAGRMTNAFDGANRALQIGYTIQGLPTTITSANGLMGKTIYDAVNRPISVTDANGVTVTNQFDAINELLKRTWPDQISEGFGYATNGLVAYTNRDGNATFYGRDGAGRLTAVTNANQEVTQFGYDSLNHVTSLIDGLLHHTTWQYNEYGWLTNKIDGLTRNAFRYAYNANGWVTNRWTPEKGNTGYAYDNVGNLKSIVYPQQTINYAYDALNRLTNMVDAVGTTAFSYTPAGQLQTENGPWANDTLTYSYVQGLQTALTLSQTTSNWSQSYGYDSSWRLQTLTSPAGSFTYSYNFQPASSLVTGISLPNGANIVNSYDSLARLTGTELNNYWGHTLDGYTYTPDALGLRTNIVRNLGLTSSSVSVGYDNIAQVNGWFAKETNGTPRLNEQLGFGYDSADNLHLRTNNLMVQTFTVDAANELTNVTRIGTFTLSGATPAPATSVTVNGQSAQTYGDFAFAATNLSLANGQNTFTNIAQNVYGVMVTNIITVNFPQSVTLGFDNNGDLTNDGLKSLSYDSENQLTNATIAGKIRTDFLYDGLNRLRIKRDFAWTNNAWALTNETRLVCDGVNIIQHRNSNNVPVLTLTRGLDLSGSLQGAGGIGGLLALTDGTGASYYFHQDAGGNVTALMDGMENIVARREYDPFLRTINLTGSKQSLNPYWGSGWLLDNFDLLHAPRRTYTSNPPRWTSNDPIQEWGGINQPGFVANNPVNYVDPLGLWTFEAYGGAIFGGYLSFGYNYGHFSFRAGLGAAAGYSVSFDPKPKQSDLTPGTWEGSLIGKADIGAGPVGAGIEGEVGGTKDPCDKGKKFASAGVSGSALILSGNAGIGEETEPNGADDPDKWHYSAPPPNWQLNIPTDGNVWKGNWLPKERASSGGFVGPFIGHQF